MACVNAVQPKCTETRWGDRNGTKWSTMLSTSNMLDKANDRRQTKTESDTVD